MSAETRVVPLTVNSPVNVPADTPKPVVNEFIWTLFSVYMMSAEAVPVRALAATSADAIISFRILVAPKPIQERTPQPTISMSFELSEILREASAVRLGEGEKNRGVVVCSLALLPMLVRHFSFSLAREKTLQREFG
jgi:hypothetical protein